MRKKEDNPKKKSLNVVMDFEDWLEWRTIAKELGLPLSALVRRILHIKKRDMDKNRENEVKNIFRE